MEIRVVICLHTLSPLLYVMWFNISKCRFYRSEPWMRILIKHSGKSFKCFKSTDPMTLSDFFAVLDQTFRIKHRLYKWNLRRASPEFVKPEACWNWSGYFRTSAISLSDMFELTCRKPKESFYFAKQTSMDRMDVYQLVTSQVMGLAIFPTIQWKSRPLLLQSSKSRPENWTWR